MTATTTKSTAVASPGAAHLHPAQPDQAQGAESASRPPPSGRTGRGSSAATGTPSCRAAVRAPPLAKTALPKRVRHSAQVATAVSPSHHSRDTRNRASPSCRVEPKTACGRRPPAGGVQPGHAGGSGERLDAGLRGALEHQEGRQGHEEAGQAGVHHEEAVDQPDPQGRRQGDQQRGPGVPAGLLDQQRGDEGAGDGQDADREVELAGDQQEGDRDTADAQERPPSRGRWPGPRWSAARAPARRTRRPRRRGRPARAGSAGPGRARAVGARATSRPAAPPAWAGDR